MDKDAEQRELDALGITHPSPLRGRLSAILLMTPLLVPPVLWAVQLVVSYVFITNTCFPNPSGPVRAPVSLGGSTAWIIAVIVSAAAILASAALGFVSLHIWRRTGGQDNQPRSALLDIGEGRTSFLAHWGIFVSFGFLVVTIFDSLPLFLTPLCGN